MCNKYNGYTNYETWAVNLWLDNDEGEYNYIRGLASEAIEESKDHRNIGVWQYDRIPVFLLEDKIKEYVEDNDPLAGDASMFSDLLSAALSVVNWQEIAENVLEDFDEYQEYLDANEESEEETEEE